MTEENRTFEEQRVDGLGCGLGIYTMLLLGICVLGLLGLGGSTYALFHFKDGGPAAIQPGHEVQVYQLSALRRTGLVGVDEKPWTFHDESRMLDGSTACALMSDRLVRVESPSDGGGWSCGGDGDERLEGWQIYYSNIASVESIGTHYTDAEVIASGVDEEGQPLEIRCYFGPEEGAIRVKRQLQTESGLEPDP